MIYAIEQGCYSDREVIGYFDNLDDAATFCVEKNKNNVGSYDEYRVLAVDELVPLKKKSKYYFAYIVLAHYVNRELKFTMISGDINNITIVDKYSPVTIDISNERIWPYKAFVTLPYFDEDRAMKIAQDAIYMKIAEKENM